MTPEEAFRVGFLARCAEEGLRGEALDTRLDAAATFAKRGSFGETLGSLAAVPGRMLTTGAGGAALVGVLGGAGIGTGLGMMAAPEDPGKIQTPPYLKEVQKSELAAQLRSQAAELHRLRENKMVHVPSPSRSRFGI